jgi:hypothetical protein
MILEDEVTMILQSIEVLSPNDKESQLRRLKSSSPPPCEPQILRGRSGYEVTLVLNLITEIYG